MLSRCPLYQNQRDGKPIRSKAMHGDAFLLELKHYKEACCTFTWMHSSIYLFPTTAQTQPSLPLVLTFLPAATEAWRGLQRYVTLSYIYRL